MSNGLSTVPRSLQIEGLHQWAESMAPLRIEQLKSYIRAQKEDVRTKERRERLKWFLDPKQRGKWLEDVFASERIHCPNYAVIPGSGEMTYEPDRIKEIYLTEGTAVLKNKRECPPPYNEKLAQHPPSPPDCRDRKENKQQNRSYSRIRLGLARIQ